MDDIRVHKIVSKLEASSLGWKILSDYWSFCAIGYGPKYFEYLELPDVFEQERFFSESNDDVNSIWGFDKSVTPIGRMEETISAWASCFTENLRTFENAPFDKANAPLETAAYFKDNERKSNIPTQHPLAALSPQIMAAMQIQDTMKNQQRHDTTAHYADEVASLMMGKTSLSDTQLRGNFTSTDRITPEMMAIRGRDIFIDDVFEDLVDTFDVYDLDNLLTKRNEDKPYEMFARMYQSYFGAAVRTGWASSFNIELQSFAYMLSVSWNQLKEIHDDLNLNLPDPLMIFERQATLKGWKPEKNSG
jgi:hypothetical protein